MITETVTAGLIFQRFIDTHRISNPRHSLSAWVLVRILHRLGARNSQSPIQVCHARLLGLEV